MKFKIILFIFTLCPILVFSQDNAGTNIFSLTFQEKELSIDRDFHFVTPVLLRNNQYQSEIYYNDQETTFRSPGVTFFGSLVVPGTGQIMNESWWRAGFFLALEVTSIYLAVEYRNRGRIGEREYERFANNNWSVVQYSQWLVDYHAFHGIENPYINELIEMVAGISPSFRTNVEWNQIDLNILRRVEANTPYVTTDQLGASIFSHTLPGYGSQQFYELISKYYQFQAGWRDYDEFHDNIGNTGRFFNDRFLIDRNGAHASQNFFTGVRMANQFNQDYRWSNHFISVLIANHFFSALDAFFTSTRKLNRLSASSTIIPGQQVVINYRF
ncbi:MAG: hypothetical protein EA359_08450 [Balneolaceae bacterium]|nr:MAG: hypothetical protein EA359_08450 [Balneolaceae bacterium]